MKRLLLIVAVCLFFDGWLYAFEGPIYRAAITDLPSTFDPAETKDTASSAVILQLFDTLFERNAEGNIVSSLVESYSLSEDRKTYTFNLRSNAYFHDGTPIKSSAIVHSILRAINRTNDAHVLDVIVGAIGYRQGKMRMMNGLRIVNDQTFEIHLLNPFPGLLELLSNLTFSVVPEGFSDKLKNGIIIGSGPYRLGSISPSEIVLARFDRYWGPKPDVETVIYKIVPNAVRAAILLSMGELDNTHPFQISEPATSEWHSYSYFHGSVRYVGFNLDSKLVKSRKTRTALVSVLDLVRYQRILNPHEGYPTSHFIPIGLPGYIPVEWTPPLGKEEAAKILRAIKWSGRFTFVNYLEDPMIQWVGEDICRVWRENQVPCQFEQVSQSEFVRLGHRNRLNVFVGKLMPHVPDTGKMLSFFRSDAPFNMFHSGDAFIDSSLDKAAGDESPENREKLYRQVNERIHSQVYAVPLQYMGRQTFFVRRLFQLQAVNVSGPYFQRLNKIRVVSKEPHAINIH